MSAAAATANAQAPAPKGGKKKLIILLAVVLLLVIGGGVGAMMYFSKKAAAEEMDDDGEHAKPAAAAKAHKKQPAHPPTFVPLEPFVVNLADKDADRYAQVKLNLEIDDPKVGDQIKQYMPAIRNHVLMVLSSRTAPELMSREGKERLAKAITRAASVPLGYDIEIEPEPEAEDEAADAGAKKRKKRKAVEPELPVRAVHFQDFIIQ